MTAHHESTIIYGSTPTTGLCVKAFGDVVVAGEAPGIECLAKLNRWREPATTERANLPQKAPCQFAAAFLVPAFLEATQAAEPLFEMVDRFERWSSRR